MVRIATRLRDEIDNLGLLQREQVIDRIRARNPGATIEYLERFRDEALRLYLAHLGHAEEPRGSSWIRPGDTCGILYREPRE